ncbi:MAG: preprotein translocase subunit SecG [Paludibacteraceae bacterium]|nr:preprotein translocase subunit SecG [Paludibacteraceae bacterium]
MDTALTIILIFLSILLIALVLFQKSKGGGLASGFASGNQVLGAPKTTEFLEKATWTLAALIVALSIIAVGVSKGEKEDQPVSNQGQTQEMPVETNQSDEGALPLPSDDQPGENAK